MFISNEEKKQLKDAIEQANTNIDSLYKRLNIREKELQELREQRDDMKMQIEEIKSAVNLLFDSRENYLPKSQFIEILNKRVTHRLESIEKEISDMVMAFLHNKKKTIALGKKISVLYLEKTQSKKTNRKIKGE